jgi:hypothetical protein
LWFCQTPRLIVSSEAESPELDLRQRVLLRNARPDPTSLPPSTAADSDADSPVFSLADRIRKRQGTRRVRDSSSPPTEKSDNNNPVIVVDDDSGSTSENDSLPSPKRATGRPPRSTTARRRVRPNVIGSDSDESDDDDDGVSKVGGRQRLSDVHSGKEKSDSESDGDSSFVNIYEPGNYHLVGTGIWSDFNSMRGGWDCYFFFFFFNSKIFEY